MRSVTNLPERLLAIPDPRLERERDFHDRRYADEQDARSAEKRFYAAIAHGAEDYTRTVQDLADGADVLEVGCGMGEASVIVAPSCRSLTGIDISEAAVAAAERRASAHGLRNARFTTADAERTGLPDDAFDLAFGSGIVHHLEIAPHFAELARVLRPGGSAVFWEPLGHNPLINWYRRRTPQARTPDEHPLLRPDFDLARRYFAKVDLRFYGLLTLGCIPFAGGRLHQPMHALASAADRMVLAAPALRWQAWYVLMVLTGPTKGGRS